MKVLSFARAMRRRGWRMTRISRGFWVFGIRFPNGMGATAAMDARTLACMRLPPDVVADHLTREAAISARHDLRGAIA